jgi:hypothetical protein
MAIVVTTVEEMRRLLVAEGVFTAAPTADEPTVRMLWAARNSPEYRHRLAELKFDG